MSEPRIVMTVLGPLEPEALGTTDAHQHAWVAPVAGAEPGAPRLNDRRIVLDGLLRYRETGGGSLVDCQPGGCGRDGVVLAELSRDSGVQLIACTGFHLQRYYPSSYWLWRADADTAFEHFVSEIRVGLGESLTTGQSVRAGFIKIACTADLDQTPAALLEAAAGAAVETGVAVLAHTDQGHSAEQIVARLLEYRLPASRLVLCHVDKRPDFGLHRELAQGGLLLEYDTFFRPKYEPDRHVWPLLLRMVEGGFAGSVAMGTDMADLLLWQEVGPVGLVTSIVHRLQSLGIDPRVIMHLTGQNIAARLAHRATARTSSTEPA